MSNQPSSPPLFSQDTMSDKSNQSTPTSQPTASAIASSTTSTPYRTPTKLYSESLHLGMATQKLKVSVKSNQSTPTSQPTASASGSSTPSTPYRTPTKLYSEIPISEQHFGPPPAKKAKKSSSRLESQLNSFQAMLTSKFLEIDTNIKSALWSVVEENPNELKDSLQKTRRLMKGALNKSDCMLKGITEDFQSEMETLIKTNYDLQREVDEAKEKIKALSTEYAADLFTDSDKEDDENKGKSVLN